MARNSPRLGRGLSALIKPAPPAVAPAVPSDVPVTATDTPSAPPGPRIHQLPLDRVHPNAKQPRRIFVESRLEELAASIRTHGVLQPIVVRPADDGYEIIAGERRWRAARLAQLEEIPALIRHVDDAGQLELALIENLQREDLGPLERAAGYQQYMDAFGGSADELAQRLGESRASIANYLRLLRLSPEIRDLLGAGELGMGQARAIAGIADPQRQLAVARLAVRRNLSVRQVEELARANGTTAKGNSAAARPDGDRRHYDELAAALGKSLGLPVKLLPGKKKNSGRLVVQFRNLEEFDQIAQRLGGDDLLD